MVWLRPVGHAPRTRYSASGRKRLPWRPGLAGSSLVALAVALALCLFQRVTVVGDSMAPGLQPGDRLLVRKASRRRRRVPALRAGDIVVANDPRQPARALVKRVAAAEGSLVWLVGDNPGHSTDSRDFGPVPLDSVLGRAIYRYSPPARAGRLPF